MKISHASTQSPSTYNIPYLKPSVTMGLSMAGGAGGGVSLELETLQSNVSSQKLSDTNHEV